ncbi:MAG: acylglycerol kinase family protein [Bacteroidia bacterium]
MKSDSNWHIILNPVSGKGKGLKRWPAIEQSLHALGIKWTRQVTEAEGHVKSLIHTAIAEGARNFLLVGGDGTHFEAINAIFTQQDTDPQDINLSCLPAGTGNDWCRTIYPKSDYHAILDEV